MWPDQLLRSEGLSTALLLNGILLMVINQVVPILKSIPGQLKDLFLRLFSVTIEIPENTTGFDSLKAYLARQRILFGLRNTSAFYDGERQGADAWRLIPAPGSFHFWHRGRLVQASRGRRELEMPIGSVAYYENLHLRIYFGGKEALQEILEDAHLASLKKRDVLYVHTHDWKSWTTHYHRRLRPIDTVCMAAGMAERVLSLVREFRESRDWYQTLGIPHRKGFLLTGPPGNGKTSLIKAVASELGMSVAVLCLGSQLDDESLLALFHTLPANSCVLIEDIDCVFAERKPVKQGEAERSRVTFSGLLNALDGVASREGYVLFMTTNHPERLDPALIRPGRIDHRIEIGNAVPEQASRYFRRFHAGREDLALAFGEAVGDGNVSMAAIQELLLSHREDPEGALRATLTPRPQVLETLS